MLVDVGISFAKKKIQVSAKVLSLKHSDKLLC